MVRLNRRDKKEEVNITGKSLPIPTKKCIENGKYTMAEENTKVTKLNAIWRERKNKFGLKYAD